MTAHHSYAGAAAVRSPPRHPHQVLSLALLCAALSWGCGSHASRTAPAQAGAARSTETGESSVISFRGHVQLDPRAGYLRSEGDVWQHLFYLDGELFDAMVCYARNDRCEVLDLQRGDTPSAWSATVSQPQASMKPFVLRYEVPPNGDWRAAPQVELRVDAAGLGEAGATTLYRDPAAAPPAGQRERLRAVETLRRAYEIMAHNYVLGPPAEQRFPRDIAATVKPPPCAPFRVHDEAALAWLGLKLPAVLSWAFSVESHPSHGTLLIIAQRDRTC
ncbi:MAG TPA: hypothetical protein VG963_15195, partial [Polyangiaceae bacterium]|nr:hypothetical protein [Polyangiaceae bacterium]